MERIAVFQDQKLGKVCETLTTQAKVAHRWNFIHDHIGYNTGCQTLPPHWCAQLEQFEHFLANKRRMASVSGFLQGWAILTLFQKPAECHSNFVECVLLKNLRNGQILVVYQWSWIMDSSAHGNWWIGCPCLKKYLRGFEYCMRDCR